MNCDNTDWLKPGKLETRINFVKYFAYRNIFIAILKNDLIKNTTFIKDVCLFGPDNFDD